MKKPYSRLYSTLAIAASFADDQAYQGNAFSIETIFNVPNGATLDVVFDTRTLLNHDEFFVVFPTVWHIDSDYMEIELGICTAYDAGTSIALDNRNYLYSASHPAHTIVTYGTARTITGYQASTTRIPVGTGAAAPFLGGGGPSTTGTFKVLDPQYIYIFRTLNDTGSVRRLSLFSEVFEVPAGK